MAREEEEKEQSGIVQGTGEGYNGGFREKGREGRVEKCLGNRQGWV